MALPNPVIVIPGITASHLDDCYLVSPEAVWSNILHKSHDRIVLHPDNLKYELREPARVTASQIFGIPYGDFVEELRHNLTEQHDQPVPVYPFPYDWRQPLDTIEEQLGEFVLEVIERTTLMKHYHRQRYADDPHVDLVGHSMGGLIIAGYLERAGLNARVGKVATLGSPFRGSYEAPIKVVTGTASLGPDTTPNSREREAARLTPALYHLLPSFPGAITADPGLPTNFYEVDTWQSGVLDTLAEFIRLNGLDGRTTAGERTTRAREVLASMLDVARAHRTRLEGLRLNRTSLQSSSKWLCVVGVDATTRVSMAITQTTGGPMFDLSGAGRVNHWGHGDTAMAELTGDGTVPFRGAVPAFLDREELVCVRPDDFGYFELKDKALLKVAGFHSVLPSLNLAQRLVVSHLRGKATKGVWGTVPPGVSHETWRPPIAGLSHEA